MRLHESGSQENDGIDQSHDPLVLPFASDTKFLWEGQVGTVRPCLVPSLRGCSNGTQTDRVPEHKRAIPLVIALVREHTALLIIELNHIVKVIGFTRNESSAAEEVGVLAQIMCCSKSSGISNSLFPGGALQK